MKLLPIKWAAATALAAALLPVIAATTENALHSVSNQTAPETDHFWIEPGAMAGAPSESGVSVQGSIMVPAYPSIPTAGGVVNADLAVLLSIRNASHSHALTIRRIEALDSAGRRLKHYLGAPVEVSPLGTISLFLPEGKMPGGAGAKLQIDWGAGNGTPAPLVEAVMLGKFGAMSIAFASRGVSIEK
jgi:hypothetical protein